MQEVDEAKDAKEAEDKGEERGPSAATALRRGGRDPSGALRVNGLDLEVRSVSAEGSFGRRRVRHAPKLSIRNLDVIDFGPVRGISNFLKGAWGMEAGAGDGVREVLKLFPIRKSQVVDCEALSIF